jgi:hypothetical protein
MKKLSKDRRNDAKNSWLHKCIAILKPQEECDCDHADSFV